MLTYRIEKSEEQEIFIRTVAEAVKKEEGDTECNCPICEKGRIKIVQSKQLNNYIFALCDYCGAGAFN